jgi:predicted Co/Zn/Cd cation transporter (cation efflux family)
MVMGVLVAAVAAADLAERLLMSTLPSCMRLWGYVHTHTSPCYKFNVFSPFLTPMLLCLFVFRLKSLPMKKKLKRLIAS